MLELSLSEQQPGPPLNIDSDMDGLAMRIQIQSEILQRARMIYTACRRIDGKLVGLPCHDNCLQGRACS